MKIGKEIRRRRKAMKWNLEELAHRAETDSGNLSRLERDKQGASSEMLANIARALGCTVADFYKPQDGQPDDITAGFRRIPIISYVQAGDMAEAADPYAVGAAEDWVLTNMDLSTNSFALRIKGESMLKDYEPGDIIIIDPAVEPMPGDFVVAKNSEHEATFKKYKLRGINEQGENVIELVPLNENYPSIRSDITPIRIIGTMMEFRKQRKK